MKKAVFLVTLSMALMISGSNTHASERLVLRYVDTASQIARLTIQGRKVTEVYGELSAITPGKVTIEAGGTNHIYRLSPQAEIYCNGLPSVWYAVRPVSDRAFFEADVLLNDTGEIEILNAYYYGESCVINGWTREVGRLILSVYLPNSDETRKFVVAEAARIPEDPDWLTEGGEIFALYNFKQEIRAVFLPD